MIRFSIDPKFSFPLFANLRLIVLGLGLVCGIARLASSEPSSAKQSTVTSSLRWRTDAYALTSALMLKSCARILLLSSARMTSKVISKTSRTYFLPTPSDSNQSVAEENRERPRFIILPKINRSHENSGAAIPKQPEPKNVRSSIQFDSSSLGYRISENAQYGSDDSIDIGIPMDYSLDAFLLKRQSAIQQKVWDSLLTKYDLQYSLDSKDIGAMLSKLSGVSIPIPPSLSSIFGKPEISINVTGEVLLRAGWRWDSQSLGTASAFGQTQSAPIFTQQINLNANARIGDKMNFGVNWGTQRISDFDNQFKIGFTGYDDDIIKKIEVGNVQFETPSSLIRSANSLFGIRADFQFGPLFLKSVASQRRGERRVLNARGGTSRTYFSKRAYDFAKNHFFLDTSYIPVYNEYFKSDVPQNPLLGTKLIVKEIEVYESTNDVRDVLAAEATCYANLDPIKTNAKPSETYPSALKRGTIIAGDVERGRFLRLDKSRYDIDLNLGELTILNLRVDRTYAVAYRIDGATTPNEDDLSFGTFANTVDPKDTLILKLVYRQNFQPGFKSIWKRQLRNHYSMDVSQANADGARVNVWYFRGSNDSSDVISGSSDKIVTILGADRTANGSGTATPDGQFDVIKPFFNPVRGEIVFPSLEPFRKGLRDYFGSKGNPQLAEQYVYNEIYDTTSDIARLQSAKDRFVITGEISGTGNRINLGYNIAQGSVRVLLDGVQLRENDDYTVDYYSGSVTMKNPRASTPNANLTVDYEQNDLFNVATKTLLGLRADYQLFKKRTANSTIGFTTMFYNQAPQIDRVRVGEEPVANTMIGLDGQLQADVPWLTRALDALPLYDTREKSTFSLRGEWALMLPNPNKRVSETASDNGAPVAFIDDFEGAQRNFGLGLQPTQWSHSSQPVDSTVALADSTRSYFRGKTTWFQYFLPRVPRQDPYPNDPVLPGQNFISPMVISFDPDIRGVYNANAEFIDSLNTPKDDARIRSFQDNNRQKIWGGFQRLLSSFNTNFDNDNIDFLEITMWVGGAEPGAHMYIDLGQISEDIIPNQRLDTEDGITIVSNIQNNQIDDGEDRGLDSIVDSREKEVYPSPLNSESDPARDNFSFDFTKDPGSQSGSDFEKYNGMEGNSKAEAGQFPDTEILNRNNGQVISLDNSYFNYEINLDQDSKRNPQVVGEGRNGWKTWRIPLRGKRTEVGSPLFSNIQYVRVWFKGGKVDVQIADWQLTGARWQRSHTFTEGVSALDSVLSVQFVGTQKNSGAPDFYTIPPGVMPPRNLALTQASYSNDDFRQNEQSMAIGVKNLKYGEDRMAIQVFRNPMDIFFYKQLKFFWHGDATMPSTITNGAIPTTEAFIRFGIDSGNYYEYRRPLIKDWSDLKVELEKLTAIKSDRPPDFVNKRFSKRDPDDPSATFIVKGNPTLTRVNFFGFGMANPTERFPNDLTSTMWVNELRLIEPERSPDWSGNGSFRLQAADLFTLDGSYQKQLPNFHRLEERFGNRINSSQMSVSGTLNADKLLGKTFKDTKIPVAFTHTESISTPLFQANNDVNLNQAGTNAYRRVIDSGGTVQQASARSDEVLLRSQTLRVEDSWGINGFRFGIPWDNWIMRETFNKLTLGFSYGQVYERSPVYQKRVDWNWRATGAYSVSIPSIASTSPLKFLESVPVLSYFRDMKFNFLPQTFSTNATFNRSRITEQSWFWPFPSPVQRAFSSQHGASFSWKLWENGFLNPSVDYQVGSGSSLVPYELDRDGRQLNGSDLSRLIFFNNGALVNVGALTNLTQTVTFNFRPRIPEWFSINKFFDLTGNYTSAFTFLDRLQPDPATRDVAKTAAFNSNMRGTGALRLKALGNEWFGNQPGAVDTSGYFSGSVLKVFGKFFKTIFLDYENLSLNFKQDNTANNPGVYGGSGISNFWGRTMTFRDNQNSLGPSAAYMLGLVGSPHGGVGTTGSSAFPFFAFTTDNGLRPPNALLQDTYTQRTSLDAKTSRPLWPGATLDLSWKSEFSYNLTRTVVTDGQGVQTFSNVNSTQQYNRSFLTLPPFLFLAGFQNTVEHVVDLYNERATIVRTQNLDTTVQNRELSKALSESFRDGLQAFSFFGGGDLGRILPAVNWALRWEGLEKAFIWGGIAKRVSLEHSYVSNYVENARLMDIGRVIDVQTVQMQFQPLIGMTFTFDEQQLKGLLTANFRYNTSTNHSVSTSARTTIAREHTKELQINASYVKRGLEFAFLGLSLKNDLEFSFQMSLRDNESFSFDVLNFLNEQGRTVNGQTQITVEPRIRYTMSQRVTASAFVRYEGNFTKGAATPGFSNTQAGVEIRLSVSGGR